MALEWHPCYGGFQRSGGVQTNVLLGGSPERFLRQRVGSPVNFQVDLQQAHQEIRRDGGAGGYGKGLGFEGLGFDPSGHYRVRFALDLVSWSMFDNGTINWNSASYFLGSGADPNNWIYGWRCIISVSTSTITNFSPPIFNQIIFNHDWRRSHIYFGGGINGFGHHSPAWHQTARESQWSSEFTLPRNTTYVKIEIAGANAFLRDENIFPIEDLIREFRPMAIRQAGTWRSLDNPGGFLSRRSGGIWQPMNLINHSHAGVLNEGSSRIRRSSGWHAQSRIGN